MRWIVLILLAAAAGGLVYLVGSSSGPEPREASRSANVAEPERVPGDTHPAPGDPDVPPAEPDPALIALAGKARTRAPALQQELEAFVDQVVTRGAQAVPGLRAFLESPALGDTGVAWKVASGRLAGGYPSVRAAAIVALTRIAAPSATQALRAALERTGIPGETYLLAKELADRGVEGWQDPLFALVERQGAPAEDPVRTAAVALVAQLAPEEAVRRIEADAPRGETAARPKPTAAALTTLPYAVAEATTQRLLADAAVRPTAKLVYARLMLLRPELESVELVQGAWARRELPDALRNRLASEAAAATQTAVRRLRGDARTRRVQAVEALIESLYLDRPDDPRKSEALAELAKLR